MRTLKLLPGMLVAAAVTATAPAFAIDATLYFTGQISQPSCTVAP